MADDKPGSPARFAWPRAAAHWLIALLILFLLGSGLFGLGAADDADPGKIDVLRAHMIAGVAALVLIVLYAAIALFSKRPPRVASGHALLGTLALVVHAAMPLCALVMIASGIATVRAAGLADIVFAASADRLPASVAGLASFKVHAGAARLLLALTALHILGALYHQFVLRDGLFGRMRPWGRGRE